MDHATKPVNWKWSEERALGSHICVMNYFIEHQDPDELKMINPAGLSTVLVMIRNSGRGILYQGTSTSDSGHLAKQALKHWPPHGSYCTQVYIIANDHMKDSDEDNVLD
eukprot:6674907-Ditylum_brightwellii.AAC.1